MENEWAKLLADTIIPAAGTILVALAGWVVAMINKHVTATVNNANAKAALSIITDLIETTTDSLQQTVVETAKAGLADGKLTEEERNKIKEQAVAAVMRQIPPAVKKSAELAVVSVQDYVSDSIEQAVLTRREK